MRTRAGVDSAIDCGVLTSPVRSYRGLRDCEQVFGVEAADLERLVGEEWVLRGYASTSVVEPTARRFGRGAAAAVLALDISARVRAAWLPLAGLEEYRDEAELLLAHPCRIVVHDVVGDKGRPTLVVCEILE